MKKVLLVLIVLMLSACVKNPLVELGYSEEEIQLIETLGTDEKAVFLNAYNPEYLKIVNHQDFQEEKFLNYLEYYNDFDLDTLVYLINHEYSPFDLEYIKQLYQDPFFILKNLDNYLINQKDSPRLTIEYVNTMRYKKDYEDVKASDLSKGIHVLVNKYHYLDEDYEPDNLTWIEPSYGINARLNSEAYEAYKKMSDDANKDGMNFYITSPYRPYSSQYRLYNGYLQNDPQEVVDTYSARPGYSEHQSGLAVDILTYDSNFATFEYTSEAKWLYENAYKYGFILRYPKDKEDITGYMYEPWHYRYVGDIAKEVYNSNVTYDEYYAYYLEG